MSNANEITELVNAFVNLFPAFTVDPSVVYSLSIDINALTLVKSLHDILISPFYSPHQLHFIINYHRTRTNISILDHIYYEGFSITKYLDNYNHTIYKSI